MIFPSKKELEEKYREENPPDFNTHANYVDFLNNISKGMDLELNQVFRGKIKNPSKLLKQKIKLIKFTLESVKEEFKIISENEEFAVVCCSWIPVKSYYIIFNSLLILKYLITCDEKSFSSGHFEINNYFKGCIEREEIKFTKEDFNKIYKEKDVEKIWNWTSSSGESLKKMFFVEDDRLKHILKKIIDYKRKDFKRSKGIKKLAGKNKIEFLKITKINLSDFFYCYRIKANYSGMDFLDKDIPDHKFKYFYNNYVCFTNNYFKCLEKGINELAFIRLGNKVFN